MSGLKCKNKATKTASTGNPGDGSSDWDSEGVSV